MRIVYKGTRSGKSRVAIITYADNEENKAYDIARKIKNITSYKVDTGISGMLIIDVDDMNDYNNLKEWYKEFKKTSCNDNEESDNTKENDNETATDSADSTDSADNTESDNKTPAELKAEINKKYGVNAVYYDTDSILCDFEKQIVNVSYNTSNKTSQTCNIKAYYNGKELSVPYSAFKCVDYAIEYITSLYKNHVVSYDTVFILKCGSQAKEYTIHTLIDIPDLIQYNIDDINNGLKTDYYGKVREGVERLCSLIDDDHVCVVGFKYTKHTFDYAITKSKYTDSYNFKRGNNNCIRKPSEIARFIFYHTSLHEVILKYWHTIKEGETK